MGQVFSPIIRTNDNGERHINKEGKLEVCWNAHFQVVFFIWVTLKKRPKDK